MGLDLSAKRKPKSKAKSAAEDPVVEEKSRSTAKTKLSKKPKLPFKKAKTKPEAEAENFDSEDVEVKASGRKAVEAEVSEAKKVKVPEVAPVPAFRGGFVHSALDGAVNTHWRRSAESDLLLAAMEEALVIDGLFVGSIYAKASFVQKTGGALLL